MCAREVLLSKYRLVTRVIFSLLLALSLLCTGRRSVFHFRLSMYRSRMERLSGGLDYVVSRSTRSPSSPPIGRSVPPVDVSHLSSFVRIGSREDSPPLCRRATSSRCSRYYLESRATAVRKDAVSVSAEKSDLADVTTSFFCVRARERDAASLRCTEID